MSNTNMSLFTTARPRIPKSRIQAITCFLCIAYATMVILPLDAFTIHTSKRHHRHPIHGYPPTITTLQMSPSSSSPGDKLRESTGKRPSLNPTIINAISEALLHRSTNPSTSSSEHPESPPPPMEVIEGIVSPMDVAIAAGQIAANAIENRAKSSTAVEGDKSSAFTQEESQLVAGRVVGVVMRWKMLEDMLVERVKGTKWVMKYREENSFGLVKEECVEQKDGDEEGTVNIMKERVRMDPLLRMCRAECLYALFLKEVEMPSMAKAGLIAVDAGSGVDFLEGDRLEVLFPDGFE